MKKQANIKKTKQNKAKQKIQANVIKQTNKRKTNIIGNQMK